ncbi:hypothetical protein HNR19_000633 [Nocardioides thalensis]|uniref:PKD domain-containing protein n=1 Tax=Nocardioides thalensis TaxID=1914755 RepID=A0A853BXS5_9ACTN|nr:PKD domain-containing protein [Nocardioides thalensis]NYI99934.1 hypothetical protein [Nocardioides thalensis]
MDARLIVASAALTILFSSAPAAADVDVDPGDGFFGLEGESEMPGDPGDADNAGDDGGALPEGEYHHGPMCNGGACAPEFVCPDGSYAYREWIEAPDGETLWDYLYCPGDVVFQGPTPGMIAQAFRRIPLPASPLIIEPPDGRTLVNFETNFYTEKERLFRSVTLLGQRVDLRIDVHSYTWHFDDGEKLRTSDPGAPYPKLQITHNYLQAGAYRPRLDTTYVADYRVNGGAWQTVPGSVTIEGSPESLRAVEARPILTG